MSDDNEIMKSLIHSAFDKAEIKYNNCWYIIDYFWSDMGRQTLQRIYKKNNTKFTVDPHSKVGQAILKKFRARA